jgi:HAD superfamily hydrolase (TIGR01662 family)
MARRKKHYPTRPMTDGGIYLDNTEVAAALADLDRWERLCWLIQEECHSHVLPTTYDKRFAEFLPLLGDHPLSKQHRQNWTDRALMPVYFEVDSWGGKSGISGWHIYWDWERRLLLLERPDPVALREHQLATLRQWNDRYLLPYHAQPGYGVVAQQDPEGTRAHCTLCGANLWLLMPFWAYKEVNDNLFPVNDHRRDCRIRRLAGYIRGETPVEPDYQLILFDLDGTLTTTKSGEDFRTATEDYPAHEDWQWLPGRREKLRALREAGVKLAIVTNQGGVGFGFMREEDIAREIAKVAFDADIQFVYICYDHPTASIERYKVAESPNRKPAPGMLLSAMKASGVAAEHTLMVGDMTSDRDAAKAAGVDFQYARDFFMEA